ncbi:probable dolichyl-diphosphooligosaccharide--protein glycosyltransferase subunit 3B isoform X2 [Eutrema salsugineum]|uniref:probable dolichyl-diphosphooligosaccharide--protein glycosyltransferase subunit 3B isoform X2 n=1 Tax=Eutrema salsugineum TaxID=72664 RepID=UPI000CED5017|nr:probable dolichyl-diphosphooligosaccharide--protein glycosyltransferase subunit 3B isoform X2 [Eutrema salsugineum]
MVVGTNLASRFFLFTALLFAAPISFADSEHDSDLIAELISLRSAADSGVIRLDDDGVSRFLTSVSTPRPYSLIIFFDAVDLHSKSEFRLVELRREFEIVSASFIANNNGSDVTKLFFCEIDSTHSAASFHRFAVESLPHICLVDPWMDNLQDESGQMERGDFEGLAESMAEFVERRTKLTVGPIHRPPLLSKTQIAIITALIVISIPILIKKVLKGETLLHDHRVWLSGAVFVYFFSVAGTMHNIIRKVPMFLRDHEDPSNIVFFYGDSEFQLGTEGFAVGFLYTVVGLILAYVTNALVVYLDNWKTGYEIHPYWPSSWH